MDDNLATATPGEAILSRGGSRRLGWLAPLLLLAAGGIAVAILLPPEASVTDDRPVATLTVAAVSPLLVEWDDTIVASGAIAAWQEASVGTQVGGYQIDTVRVDVGDQVRKGQVLATLNPALLRAEEVELVARQEQAEANRQRALLLQASGGISNQDVLQSGTAARIAAAQLAAKRLQLRYMAVRAPDDGVITARAAALGTVPSVGQELFRLIRRNRLEWRGELTAAQLSAVRLRQAVALTLPDGATITAIVRQIAPGLDNGSRLGIVYADLPSTSSARAGMFATGDIVVARSQALTLPSASIVMRDGRSYVMKLIQPAATATVAQQLVIAGRRQDDQVEIIRGLTPTDRVVASGVAFLNDGDTVRIAHTAGGDRRP